MPPRRLPQQPLAPRMQKFWKIFPNRPEFTPAFFPVLQCSYRRRSRSVPGALPILSPRADFTYPRLFDNSNQ
jgi:hypothetical protein